VFASAEKEDVANGFSKEWSGMCACVSSSLFLLGWGHKKKYECSMGKRRERERDRASRRALAFLVYTQEMPSAPYWKSPQLSLATLSLRAWSKPHACCRACPSRGKSSSTSCPGIVRPLPYPDAVGCTSCASKQEACAKPGCGGCA
jgi:hypothetical protein